MFIVKKQNDNSGLEDAIYAVLQSMDGESPASEEYSKMADQLVKLYALKETDSKSRISPDTLAIVAGNLLGILMIVGHEQAHVVTSKALNFILKLR